MQMRLSGTARNADPWGLPRQARAHAPSCGRCSSGDVFLRQSVAQGVAVDFDFSAK